jgi:hypothetical protein
MHAILCAWNFQTGQFPSPVPNYRRVSQGAHITAPSGVRRSRQVSLPEPNLHFHNPLNRPPIRRSAGLRPAASPNLRTSPSERGCGGPPASRSNVQIPQLSPFPLFRACFRCTGYYRVLQAIFTHFYRGEVIGLWPNPLQCVFNFKHKTLSLKPL